MANISVTVQDGNNITLVSTPTATQVITIDRGIAGPAGPAGVPGGSTTQVQYNLASAFAGSPNFTFNGSNLVLQSASASDAFRITQTGAGNALVVEDSANPDTTPFVIDNTGRVIVGYTTRFAPDVNAPTIFPQVSVFGVSATAQYSAFSYINAAANAPVVSLSKSRGATIGTNTIVANNDTIGIVKFTAADGTAFVPAASISAQVDGTPGLNDMPGRLVFSTTADGAATSTERMRIDSAGNVGIGTSSPATRLDVNGSTYNPLIIRRDGGIDANTGVVFQQATTYWNAGVGTDGNFAIAYNTSNLQTSAQFRITNAGNVGIGTSAPTSTLSVAGTANVTGNVTLGDASTDTVTVNGYMGVGGAPLTNNGLRVRSTALSGIDQNGIASAFIATSSATSSASGVASLVTIPDSVFTVSEVHSFRAYNATKGASATITNLYGVYIADQTQGTNNYGITSLVSSGTNKWNIYASGTANNYFAGNLGIGTSAPAFPLDVSSATSQVIGRFTSTDATGTSRLYAVCGTATGIFQQYGQSHATNANELRIISPGSLGISTGGTVKAIIDASGNLGIGTTSPGYKLDVRSGSTGTTAYFNSLATTAYSPTAYNGGSARVILYGGGATSAFTGIQFSQGGSFETFFGAVQNASGYGDFVWQGYGGAYAERMRLDSAGNLGLGVTPSAWSASAKAIQLGAYSMLYQNASGYPELAFNTYINTSNIFTYQVSGNVATRYSQTNGQHQWFNAPSGTAGNAITFTQAMTLDASGNLGVGTTSPTTKLHISSGDLGGATFSGSYNFGSPNYNIRIINNGNTLGYISQVPAAGGIVVADGMRYYGGGPWLADSTSAESIQMVGGNIVFTTNAGLTGGGLFTPAERMRLDSAGNLGIGTTSPTNARLEVTDNSTYFQWIGRSVGVDRAINLRAATGYNASLLFTQNGVADRWAIGTKSGDGSLYFATGDSLANGTSRVVLDFAGNLGLGVTPSAWSTTPRAFQIGTNASVFSFSNNLGIASNAYYNISNTWAYQANGYATRYESSANAAGNHVWFIAPSGTAGNAITFTQAMTLDASGNLLVGTTSPAGSERFNVTGSVANNIARFINNNAASYGTLIQYGSGIDPNGTGNEFIDCRANVSTLRFNVRSNGGITNYQANNVNLSDRREKINFAPAGEYLSKICAIPVQTFNYIDQNMEEDSGLTLGVIAQDVQAVAPELVAESNWGTRNEQKLRLSIYQTDLQYALMKCIQEQQALITTLTDRITALEAK